jgi:hypothetical protein
MPICTSAAKARQYRRKPPLGALFPPFVHAGDTIAGSAAA